MVVVHAPSMRNTYKALPYQYCRMVSSEDIINYVKASSHPVSARNLARKLCVKRSFITSTLHFASKTSERDVQMHFQNPHNMRRKKPVWTFKLSV